MPSTKIVFHLPIPSNFYLIIMSFEKVGCVRMEHLLPAGGGEVVRQAAERGILTRPWYCIESLKTIIDNVTSL